MEGWGCRLNWSEYRESERTGIKTVYTDSKSKFSVKEQRNGMVTVQATGGGCQEREFLSDGSKST